MRIKRALVIVLVGVLLIITSIVGACAQQTPTQQTPNQQTPNQQTPTQPAPAMTTINIIFDYGTANLGVLYGGGFEPRNISVSVGSTVTWNNTDAWHVHHSVVSSDGLFNQRLTYGESFSYTFTQKGSFTYQDPLYDNMDGTVIVK